MKRTRKWKFVEQEATRLIALGFSAADIAERLEVNKSSVTRWIASGKLKVPDKVVTMAPPTVRLSPAEWAKSVRGEYALSPTDEALVTLAESALSLSRDMTATASVQLAAGREFRAYAKQLDVLPKRGVAAAEQQQPAAVNGDAPAVPERKTNPPVRRRSTADPRALLTRVK